MNKKKITILFDQEVWVKLQNIAAIQNTSASKILNVFAKSYVEGKLPEDYEQRIQEKVFEILDQQIEKSLIEDIADRVAFKLGLQNPLIETVEPSKVPEIFNQPEIRQVYDTYNTDSTNEINTDSTGNTDSTAIVISTDNKDISDQKTTDSTDNTDKKKLSAEEKKQLNIAKFRRYKASDNRKAYDDTWVATKEGKARESIRRYRKGIRSPNPEFIERWGLNWDGNQWIENLD